MKIRKSESSTMPDEIDENSSNTTVYVRENIQEIERTDDDGNIKTVYTYDEKQFSKDEWEMEVLKRKNSELETLINAMLGVSE